MPSSDFKKEPSTVRLRRIWHENKGNWLLVTGVVVSLLAWSIGYFDLIPEITAIRHTAQPPTLLATGRTLIVHITGCESDEGQVVAMLYEAEHFTAESVAARVELLRIENRQALWPIHNLQFGNYIVLAFHDLNADEQFDPKTERQGISRRPSQPHPLAPDAALSPTSEAAFTFNDDKEEITVQLEPRR